MTLLTKIQATGFLNTLARVSLETASGAPDAYRHRLSERAGFLCEAAKLEPEAAGEALKLGRVEPRHFSTDTIARVVTTTTTAIQVPAAAMIEGAGIRGPIQINIHGELLDVPAGLDAALRVASEVHLDIDSGGGSSPAALRMIKKLRQSRLPVIVTIATACSAAAMVGCLAGTVRRIRHDGHIMLHSCSHIAAGHPSEFRRVADQLDRLNLGVINMYAKRTGLRREIVSEWFGDKDTWFTAQEAMALGLVDQILGGSIGGRDGSCYPVPATAEATA